MINKLFNKKSTIILFFGLPALMLLIFAVTVQARPLVHPEDAGLGLRRPVCTDCHETPDSGVVHRRFNHNAFFMENHRLPASQNPEICAMCHEQSSCNDCHAVKTELKPSDRRKSDTFRRTQHRGDYLSRHRIDGRVDPTSCFRCHGSPKTSEGCVRCHG